MTTTVDSLLDGALHLEQPAPGQGYRVNADAVLLARFAAEAVQSPADVIDLGAGVGAVALVLHTLTTTRSLTLVERDPQAAELARRNVVRAGLTDRARVVVADVDDWSWEGLPPRAPLVVVNPPYTMPGAGRRGGNPSRDAARHGALSPFVGAIRRLVDDQGGQGCICYPASSVVDLLEQLERTDLHVRSLRFVHPSAQRPARIVLVRVTRRPCTAELLAPWFDVPGQVP